MPMLTGRPIIFLVAKRISRAIPLTCSALPVSRMKLSSMEYTSCEEVYRPSSSTQRAEMSP